MKHKTYYGLLLFWCLSFISVHSQNRNISSLEIKVCDKESNTPLANAHIHFEESNYITDMNGIAVITDKPGGSGKVNIHYIGYEEFSTPIDEIRRRQPFVAKLKPKLNALEDVVVRTQRKSAIANTVSESVYENDIRKMLGKNFASAIEQIKGVNTVKSGITVAKPIIHGMYGNRILIVNNGVRQKGQQWGDDHGPELDLNAAGRVDIVKGAAAVRYGSEALGGVILTETKPLPYNRKKTGGYLSSAYGTNGKRYAVTGYMDGNISRDFAWRIQGTHIKGGDRSTANYLLNNTGMYENDISAALGYRREKYGIEAFYSRFDTKLGVLFSSQMGDVELLKKRIALGRPVKTGPFSREIDVPSQKVVHQLFKMSAFYNSGKPGRFGLQCAYQSDRRNEFHSRRNNLSHIPSLSLKLDAVAFDINWERRYAEHWKSETGIRHEHTENTNNPGTGVVPIIPNYVENDFGIYGFQKYTCETWSAEAGIRFDRQYTDSRGIDAYSQSYGGNRRFSNLTYNIGGEYRFPGNFTLVSNMGWAWRAPHVHELYANGLEHASGMYVEGDSAMISERTVKWITSLSYSGKVFGFSTEFYLQKIKNFIYDEPVKRYMTVISGTYPVFKYRQTDAFFRGVDMELRWEPFANLKYHATAGMVWANESSTGNYLPYIPSLRIMESLKYNFPETGRFKAIRLMLTHRYTGKQRRFDPETDLIDHSPPAYHIFGGEAGFSVSGNKNNKIDFSVIAENLFNKEYKEYTNRFRYYAHDSGRDIRISVAWQF